MGIALMSVSDVRWSVSDVRWMYAKMLKMLKNVDVYCFMCFMFYNSKQFILLFSVINKAGNVLL